MSAFLEVRVFPWRPRARVLEAGKLRELMTDPEWLDGVGDLGGLVIALGVWLVILIAAPLIVLVLAGLLFSIELPLLVGLGVLLLGLRFAGVVPWTMIEIDPLRKEERRTRTRSFVRALQLLRAANGHRRPRVLWSWT